MPNSRFPHLNNIVDKVWGAGNLESWEYEEAEQLVLLAKEELLKDLEVKEVDLTDRKTNWCPSKKQLEALKDLLHYNIGVCDYRKFMEVKSLYDNLTKTLDYETDRQK